MIRPTTPEDTEVLLKLTEGTGVFKPHEIEALDEVLSDYHAENHAYEHISVTYEDKGEILGYAYYAPAAMTDRTWYLYWIAVSRHLHAKGIGSKMLHYAEEDIRKRGGRVLFIETSSLPTYERTRKFYLKHGYNQEAVLHDYYTDGDDMVIFRKRLSS